MDYVYASIAACIAIIGGITDVRYGRVKNIHLLFAIVCWACVLVIDITFHKGGPVDLTPTILNVIFSAAIVIALYVKDIWAPGDGKLFLLISIVYPISLSPCLPGNIFPALDIVIYAFAVGYIALLTSALKERTEFRIIQSVSTALDGNLLSRIINIISNIGLVTIIDITLKCTIPDFLAANTSLCTLGIIAIVYSVNKKMPPVRKVIGCIGLVAYFVISPNFGMWSSIIITVFKSIVISLIIEVLNERIDKNSYRTIHGSEVKTGMILSHSSVWDMQNCIDPNLPHSTTETRRSRLTVAQAQAVQLWCRNAKRDVTIVEMLPFAPCIAVATIIHFIRFITVYR